MSGQDLFPKYTVMFTSTNAFNGHFFMNRSAPGLPKFALKVTHLSMTMGTAFILLKLIQVVGAGAKSIHWVKPCPSCRQDGDIMTLPHHLSPFTQFYYCGRQSRECDISKV